MGLEGQPIDRYHILRLLGSGGMGEVYLAQDPRISQHVAIKVLRAEVTPYPNAQSAQEAVRLFQREAKAIGQLDHPHILPLYDYGEVSLGEMHHIYLVMPYRPEGSLVAWVRQHYPDQLVPPELVAHVVNQAAEALQHAHQHQIIHQDVKPANFLIRTNEKTPARPEVFLADFGIARLMTSTSSMSQAARGTPTYMAPEQCVGQAVPASDQYALAIMAYELLTGRPPFQGGPIQIMYQHLNAEPEPPRAFNACLSSEIDSVILSALAKQPEERFRSITAFATAFRQAAGSKELADVSTIIRPVYPSENGGNLPPPFPVAVPTGIYTGMMNTGLITPQSDVAAALTSSIEHQVALAAREIGGGENRSEIEDKQVASGMDSSGGSIITRLPISEETAGPSVPAAPTSLRPKRRKGRVALIAVAACVALLLLLGGTAYTFPGLIPLLPGASGAAIASTATVTIIPQRKDLANTYTLSAVTGTPDASQKQVGARLLSVSTRTFSQTVQATGSRTSPATRARGILTFTINSVYTPFGPQTVLAGRTFTSNTGVTVATDSTLVIPAGGSASVSAHAVGAGSAGNIAPNAINQIWCPDVAAGSSNVLLALNTSPMSGCGLGPVVNSQFSGGKNAFTYAVVQQRDIDEAATTLINQNKPAPQQVLQSQLQPDETLVGIPQCTPRVTSNHKAGDQATQVTVHVTFTCSGEAYDHDGAVALATTLLTQQAIIDHGASYALAGKARVTILNATPDPQGIVTLTVSAEGVLVYQFSDPEQQALARFIAGKNQQQAQQLLHAQSGIEEATINVSGGDGQTLPLDPLKITIMIQAVSGF